jgi:hypothetical protein
MSVTEKLNPETWRGKKPLTGSVPPRRGLCRRCGEDKPVNRMMLCYKCWVITEIEDREKREGRHWHPGMPHPDWCRCELPGHNCGRSGN